VFKYGVAENYYQSFVEILVLYITLFYQLNGSIKISKKYINKYNTTTKKKEN